MVMKAIEGLSWTDTCKELCGEKTEEKPKHKNRKFIEEIKLNVSVSGRNDTTKTSQKEEKQELENEAKSPRTPEIE